MTFDIFGDFETRGYLRNTARLKNRKAVREFEHRAFLRNLDAALAHLKSIGRLTYGDVCETHRILFQEVYPWAGQDRLATAPGIRISKGGREDLFAHPNQIRASADYALKIGQDVSHMSQHPGEVMGYFAHAHPFLDGNGRTILVLHNELADRAGISIDWRRVEKAPYLAALTRELDRPGKGELDEYLEPFVGRATTQEQISGMLANLSGLGPVGGALARNRNLGDAGRNRNASSQPRKKRTDTDADLE